ncbi:unnamed protein product [Prorocentrum cordatum]|uniref:Uncharacterized protein n=1 Tax=Prorocentrum cordatum TaxID=2364126 RepID=A0ABN9UX03_9DINO|nr:unnamed protein product [Polarella glacialis]
MRPPTIEEETCSFCLPLDAGVWVEGRAIPYTLRDLERGQRVLCYDSRGRSIRYAEVLEKRVDFGEVPRVGAGLGAGAQLVMAASQAVQLARQREAVWAADLSPGRGGAVVHGAAAVPCVVEEAARQAEARGSARGWAHLAVRHPDGLSVLVGSSEAERVVDTGVLVERRQAQSARGTALRALSAQDGESSRGARSPSDGAAPGWDPEKGSGEGGLPAASQASAT